MVYSHTCNHCNKSFKTSRSLASHKYKFHSDTRSVNKDHRNLDNLSINSDIESVSVTSETSVSLALRELKDLMKIVQQRNDKQEDKLRELDAKIFSMEYSKRDDLPALMNYNHDNTNEIKWETKRQSERIGDLERKIKRLEQSCEDNMDQSFVKTVEDATNVQQLFQSNDVGSIKKQIVALKNGVLLLLDNFDHSPEIENLLRRIYDASFKEAQEIVYKNFSALQKAFTSVSFEQKPNFESEDESDENEESQNDETTAGQTENDDSEGSSDEIEEENSADETQTENSADETEYYTSDNSDIEDSN